MNSYIRYSLYAVLICFLAHAGFIFFIKPHWKWKFVQHQWQENNVKAQQYLYKKLPADEKVILGSSLSCRLQMDSLHHFFNLALNGRSIFEGLALVRKKSQVPGEVYIEMNMVFREQLPAFVTSITDPVPYHLKKSVFFLQDEYQPVGYFGELASYKITKPVFGKIKSFTGYLKMEEETFPEKQAGVLEMGIENWLKEFSPPPQQKVLDSTFLFLKQEIKYLEEKGVKIIFFEMPMHQIICNSEVNQLVRNSFHHYFPEPEYSYIPALPCGNYETIDGIHLKDQEARQFSEHFRAEINSLHQSISHSGLMPHTN
jgi:hypothetical protein